MTSSSSLTFIFGINDRVFLLSSCECQQQKKSHFGYMTREIILIIIRFVFFRYVEVLEYTCFI